MRRDRWAARVRVQLTIRKAGTVTCDDVNLYPEDTPVMVRFPRTKQEEQGDRSAWPWLPGTILEQCGPDEWDVRVDAPELAAEEDGEVWYPACFRDSSEIRAREAGRS
jgi:hypothetical protein